MYVSLDKRSILPPIDKFPLPPRKCALVRPARANADRPARAPGLPVVDKQLRKRWTIAVEMQQIDAAPPREEDGGHQIGGQGALAIG